MFQPTGIIKMTNVAFIKYKINNMKFEIACYKNKAINWRNGVEKDINEVLQTEEIYTNASHGTIAKKQDLTIYFGQVSKMDIIKTILEKGELQVSEKEREVQLTALQNDIINIITEKCVHPDSQRKFSINQIQQAIKSIGFQVKPDQPAKRQALDCMRMLLKKFYMQRAEMLISMNIPTKEKAQIMKALEDLEVTSAAVQKTVLKDEGKRTEMVLNIEPSKFRPITQVAKEDFADCIVEVISNTVTNDQVHGIENAAIANLVIRDDWKDETEEESKTKKGKASTKTKEEPIEESKGKKKAIQIGKDDEDEEEENENVDQSSQKKKKKSKKKNPQLDQRMQLEKEKEFQLEQIRLEDLNKAKQKWIQDEHDKVSKLEKPQDDLESLAGKKKCPQCKDAYFDTGVEFRAHYKTEWHVCNVKRKAKGETLLSEIEYKVHHLNINFV